MDFLAGLGILISGWHKQMKRIEDERNLHRSMANPFAVGLDVRSGFRPRTAMEFGNIHKTEKRIERVKIEPARHEPQRERERGWGRKNEQA